MVIKSTFAPSCTFSMISWSYNIQSGHNIYQMKAAYVSYRRVLSMLLLVKGFKRYVLKNTNIPIFSWHCFECE